MCRHVFLECRRVCFAYSCATVESLQVLGSFPISHERPHSSLTRARCCGLCSDTSSTSHAKQRRRCVTSWRVSGQWWRTLLAREQVLQHLAVNRGSGRRAAERNAAKGRGRLRETDSSPITLRVGPAFVRSRFMEVHGSLYGARSRH